ncbi:histone-like nucleoid-structuring protein Lsr2 [Actinomyces polynesiensis]|uniref:histone-like nucleoid-structuring protein Lsr2 n=1 Tax=Actinomyces polynesiensis TaxID=1325934 RepID=UPI0005B9C570|nr:Lsr2 family protein [Actinomyces polynesiensis]
MKKTEVVLVDDIDGSSADRTISFSVNGVAFEIDLNEEHATDLLEDFAKWESHARRVGGRTTTRRRRSSSGSAPSEAAKIRAWAQKKGIEVSDRGRIPAPVVEQYHAEND